MQKKPSSLHLTYAPFTFKDPELPVAPGSSDPHIVSDDEVTMLHYHNCFEIGYCYQGAGVFFVDDQILPFSQGDVSIIFQNQIHIAQSQQGNLSRWKFISVDMEQVLTLAAAHDLELISALSRTSGFPSIIKEGQFPEITWLIYHIILALDKKEAFYKLRVRALLASLLSLIAGIIQNSDSKQTVNRSSMLRVSPALYYISNYYNTLIRIEHLAKLCNCSLTSFRRVFMESLGMTPTEYIARVRIHMATAILRNSDSPILEVAAKVGYDTLSSFNRQFLRIVGVPPRAWRKAEP